MKRPYTAGTLISALTLHASGRFVNSTFERPPGVWSIVQPDLQASMFFRPCLYMGMLGVEGGELAHGGEAGCWGCECGRRKGRGLLS